MRSVVTSIVPVLLIFGATAAYADAPPDLAPLNCAWEKLPVSEQTRLIDEFKVELRDKGFLLHFGKADTFNTGEAARQCQLTVENEQIEQLALGLARKAAEEKAKKGIADRGEKPESIQLALTKMHEGKRERIGDALACPGSHGMMKEWDDSVGNAVRKANLRFENTRAYSWVSLGVYAVMAQEGSVRRMAGKADAC